MLIVTKTKPGKRPAFFCRLKVGGTFAEVSRQPGGKNFHRAEVAA
jgi:hypothetical protein